MRRLLLLTLLAVSLRADPSGLWAAKVRYGPDLRGSLTIAREGTEWRAEIDGRRAAVTAKDRTLSFEIPDGGSFRGAISGDRIIGHWIQPKAGSSGFQYATPVTLSKIDANRWRGTVQPLDDSMTYFIPIAKDGDAFLRNPERNAGRFVSIERAIVDGGKIRFLGAKDSVIAEAPFDGESFSIPLRGSTLDFHRADALERVVFYARPEGEPPYAYRTPPQEDDGWAVASVDDVGISKEAITRFIQMVIETAVGAHSLDLHGVLVARHGKLVLEEYFHGFSRDQLHDTRSAAKSLTSMMIGAAALHSVEIGAGTPVYEAMGVKTDDPLKRSMKLEDLLTMSSGLDCDDADDKSPGNENTMQEQTAQPDWLAYTLDLKSIRPPGQKAVYCSCQPNLAGGVLARASGRWLPDLFREWIADPLQMKQYALDLAPLGDAYMGGGARFLPRDFMKLGQVILDHGRWHGKQIVNAEWAAKSTSERLKLGTSPYAYLWWIADYSHDGHPVKAFYASGNGGQFVIGIPDLDLLISFWGGSYADHAAMIPQRDFVPQFILPAVH